MKAAVALVVSVVAVVGSFVWAVYVMFDATLKALFALEVQGFATQFGIDTGNRFMFLAQCVMERACFSLLGVAWGFYYGQQWVWWVVFGVLLVVVLVLARVVQRDPRDAEVLPGEGHWATPEQLRAEGYLPGGPERPDNPRRGYVGLHLETRKMLQVPERMRFAHTLVVGGPGARKSTGYFKQNIIQDMRDGVNIILFDLKYPDPSGGFFDMVMLAQRYKYDLQLLLPYDEHTHRFSFLAGASTETAAREVASLVIPVSKRADAGDYYRNNERIMLTALVLAAARTQSSFKDIVDALRSGIAGVRGFLVDTGDPDANIMIKAVLDGTDADKQKGIINGLLGKVEIFGDPQLLHFGTMSPDPERNVDLSKLHSGRTMVYIGIPQQKLTSSGGQVFLQMMKSTIDKELGRISRQNRGRFETPISYYLDEFANFGPLPDIGADFATMRSRRLSYHVVVQNMAQGSAVYGREEWESFFRSNFQTVLIYPRFLRFGDAELFSKLAGNLTSFEKSESDLSGGMFDPTRHTTNIRSVRRAMMSTESMKEWPDAEGVVFLNGVAPARVVLPRLDEPKIRGRYKNPYIDDYRSIDYNTDAQQWVKTYFERRAAIRRQHILAEHLEIINARIELDRARATPTTPATTTHHTTSDTPTTPSPPPSPTAATPPPTAPAAAPAPPAPRTPPPHALNNPPAIPGARRFNTTLQALIHSKAPIANITVASGKRVTELRFAPSPQIEEHYRPHERLLNHQQGFMLERDGSIGLTRRGLSSMTPNAMGYYFQLGASRLSAPEKRALRAPSEAPIGPIKKNAAKRALRRIANRAHARNQLEPLPKHRIGIPLQRIDPTLLKTYREYWTGYRLARITGAHLVLTPAIINYLPAKIRNDLQQHITPPEPDTPTPPALAAPDQPTTPDATTPDATTPDTTTESATTTPDDTLTSDTSTATDPQEPPSNATPPNPPAATPPTTSNDTTAAAPTQTRKRRRRSSEPPVDQPSLSFGPGSASDAPPEPAPAPPQQPHTPPPPASQSDHPAQPHDAGPDGPADPIISLEGAGYSAERGGMHAQRLAIAWRGPREDDGLDDVLVVPSGISGADAMRNFLITNAPHVQWFDHNRPEGLDATMAPGRPPFVARAAWGQRIFVPLSEALERATKNNPSLSAASLRETFTTIAGRYDGTRCAWMVLGDGDAIESSELTVSANVYQEHQDAINRLQRSISGAPNHASDEEHEEAAALQQASIRYLAIEGMITIPVDTLRAALRTHADMGIQNDIEALLKNVRTLEHGGRSWVQLFLRWSEARSIN